MNPIAPERFALALQLLQQRHAAELLMRGLSTRQTDVLRYTAKGFPASEIGRLMGLSRHTVMDYRKQAFGRLGVSDSCEASVIAAKAGLV